MKSRRWNIWATKSRLCLTMISISRLPTSAICDWPGSFCENERNAAKVDKFQARALSCGPDEQASRRNRGSLPWWDGGGAPARDVDRPCRGDVDLART